ncbi:Replication factor-A carboxy-terminal domain protein [Arachis hypogaea]|uniref:Replication factor-A carboxy-terminal domain protein n=1 Tax=Arachis hypogaea TaxID=3818 RepID=A0A6B9VCD6_ARAHY|nr:Replication factor-A carboxy-terminal domain protein [Arachis hypogaea]
MTTAMDMVNKINPEKEAWNLKVRVIRLWTVPTFTGQLLPNSMEMILVDESGCKIQATVRKTMIYRFKQLLSEMVEYMTTVRDAICDFIPKSALTISPFTELLKTKEDSDFLVDVVGLLVSVSEEKEYDKDGKKMKMAMMELAENEIQCALFGEYVDELNQFLSSGYAEQPVVVLQLAKVKVFRGLYHVNFISGRVKLQNVMFASKLGFNLDIPEVAAFQKSASQPIGIVGSGKNIRIEEDFMKLTPRCTVKSLDDNNWAGTFVVLAKIAEIVEDSPWWCSACVCGRGVQVESGIYFCQFCNIHVTNVTPRFKVKVLVEDSTGISIFVLFDCEASYLLNKTCAQLFEQHLKDIDVVFGTQSPIFQEIVGKTMLFKVLSRPVGMEKFKGTYPVRRVCDDAAIVGMFELSGSDLSPENVGFIPKGEGSFGKPSKVTKSPNLGLTPSSCSKLFAGLPQCIQKESSVVDLGDDEDAKCPLLKRKSADAVVDKLNEVDSSENSCDKVDESEEEYVVGVNRGSVDAEKDVKPSLKRLRRSLRLQFDEANESCGSGNDGSSGHRVN